MPFHVRITKHSDRSYEEVKLDLSENELEKLIVKPYREGYPIAIGGRSIPADDIERVRITYTDQLSEFLLSIVRTERGLNKAIMPYASDEWLVAERGKDVTDKYIIGPSGRPRGKPAAKVQGISSIDYSLNGPFPETLLEVQREIEYWASRQNEGDPGSDWEECIKNRLAQLDRIEKRLIEKRPSEDRQPTSNQIEAGHTAKWRPWSDHPLVVTTVIFLGIAAIVVPIIVDHWGSHAKSNKTPEQSAEIRHSAGSTLYQAGRDILIQNSTSNASPGPQNGVSAIPNISGEWSIFNTIESTSYRPNRGRTIGFRIFLQQEDKKVTGSGEKWSENGAEISSDSHAPIT